MWSVWTDRRMDRHPKDIMPPSSFWGWCTKINNHFSKSHVQCSKIYLENLALQSCPKSHSSITHRHLPQRACYRESGWRWRTFLRSAGTPKTAACPCPQDSPASAGTHSGPTSINKMWNSFQVIMGEKSLLKRVCVCVGRGGGTLFSFFKILGQFSRHVVGVSSYITNVPDKQASPPKKSSFRIPKSWGGGAGDIWYYVPHLPNYGGMHSPPPPPPDFGVLKEDLFFACLLACQRRWWCTRIPLRPPPPPPPEISTHVSTHDSIHSWFRY